MASNVVLELVKAKLSSLKEVSPRQVLSSIVGWVQSLRLQSWSKFVKPGNYSRPPQTTSELFSRVFGNVKDHGSNYGTIYLCFFIYALYVVSIEYRMDTHDVLAFLRHFCSSQWRLWQHFMCMRSTSSLISALVVSLHRLLRSILCLVFVRYFLHSPC